MLALDHLASHNSSIREKRAAKDKASQEAQQRALQVAEQMIKQKDSWKPGKLLRVEMNALRI